MIEEYLTQIYFKYDQQREGEKQPLYVTMRAFPIS